MSSNSILLLPPLHHGEALRSYFERTQLLNAPAAPSETYEQPRARWHTPEWCLPTGILWFARAYGEPLGYGDPSYWIARHTLAPYYASTMASVRRTRFDARLLKPSQGPRRPLLPLALSEWFAKVPTLCPACDEDSLVCRGFSQVQRHWLLPFMTRCQIHGEPLSEYPEWSPFSRGRASPLPRVPSRRDAGVRLAKESLELLEDEASLLGALGQLVKSRGFATRSGRIRRQCLVQKVMSYGKNRYEHPELKSLVEKQSSLEKLLGPLWTPRACLHPVVAQLVMNALSELPHLEQLPLWPSQRALKLAELDTALRNGASLSCAAHQVGLSVTVAVVRARAAGIVVKARPKKLTEPVRQHMLQLLSSGVGIAKVAEQGKISLVTVYRLLASCPTLRDALNADKRALATERTKAEWIRLVEANPGICAKALRAQAPSVYAYLYRHVREWLACHTPRSGKPRVSLRASPRAPDGADFALASRLRGVTKPDAMDMPVRTTKTSLLKEVGRSNHVVLPGSAPDVLLKDKSESVQQFVYRRLSAATSHLYSYGPELALWRVERESGIRPSVIARSGVRTEKVVADTRAAALRRFNP